MLVGGFDQLEGDLLGEASSGLGSEVLAMGSIFLKWRLNMKGISS